MDWRRYLVFGYLDAQDQGPASDRSLHALAGRPEQEPWSRHCLSYPPGETPTLVESGFGGVPGRGVVPYRGTHKGALKNSKPAPLRLMAFEELSEQVARPANSLKYNEQRSLNN